MPTFTNDKLLDIVTKRLVSSNAAPSLARADADIFWQVMSDDLYRQLCGNNNTTSNNNSNSRDGGGSVGAVLGLDTSKKDLTVAALQRRIGAPEHLPAFTIPRVRVGLGSFYLSSQPSNGRRDKRLPNSEPKGVTVASSTPSVPSNSTNTIHNMTGPIGLSVYEDYLVKYGLKCRRAVAARHMPDGTAQPTDINAPRMYFEAANALTSLYGRTGASLSSRSIQHRPPSSHAQGTFLSLVPEVREKQENPLRPSSSASSISSRASVVLPATTRGLVGAERRPASSSTSTAKIYEDSLREKQKGRVGTPTAASSQLPPPPRGQATSSISEGYCILDDLPTLRQALCRKFVQTVVDVIGELGADPANDVEILLHPKIGTLKIKSKVISLILADSGVEAQGDPAVSNFNTVSLGGGVGGGTAAGSMKSKRRFHDRELQLALESVARGGNGVEVEESHQFIDDEEGNLVYHPSGDGDGGLLHVSDDWPENGGGKPPAATKTHTRGVLIRAKAPMSNKMKLILQKREQAKRGKDYIEPISDEDSAFTPDETKQTNSRKKEDEENNMRNKGRTRRSAEEKDAPTTTMPANGEDGESNENTCNQDFHYPPSSSRGGGTCAVESVRRLRITSKFEPKIDHESIRRFREQQRPLSSSSSLMCGLQQLQHHTTQSKGGDGTFKLGAGDKKTLAHLDEQLARLRSQLNDPLDELERNTYGSAFVDAEEERMRRKKRHEKEGSGASSQLESPAAMRDRKMKEQEEKYLHASKSIVDENALRGAPHHASAIAKRNAIRGNPILGTKGVVGPSTSLSVITPAAKILELNFSTGGRADANPHVASGANRRFFSLKEQDVSTIEDVMQRRAQRISDQMQHGRTLKEQSRLKEEKKIQEGAVDLLIQQKETEVQVLSEALSILNKMKQKREAAAAGASAKTVMNGPPLPSS